MAKRELAAAGQRLSEDPGLSRRIRPRLRERCEALENDCDGLLLAFHNVQETILHPMNLFGSGQLCPPYSVLVDIREASESDDEDDDD